MTQTVCDKCKKVCEGTINHTPAIMKITLYYPSYGHGLWDICFDCAAKIYTTIEAALSPDFKWSTSTNRWERENITK